MGVSAVRLPLVNTNFRAYSVSPLSRAIFKYVHRAAGALVRSQNSRIGFDVTAVGESAITVYRVHAYRRRATSPAAKRGPRASPRLSIRSKSLGAWQRDIVLFLVARNSEEKAPRRRRRRRALFVERNQNDRHRKSTLCWPPKSVRPTQVYFGSCFDRAVSRGTTPLPS